MRTSTGKYRGCRAYTLPETVGVMAILMILVSALVPAVMSSIEDARLAADLSTINALTDATRGYFDKYGRFGGTGGAEITTWDHNAYEYWERNVLLREGFIESPIKSRLATAAYIRLVKVTTTSTNTAILTDIGQVGHIPGFNGNNGYYNLTRQYTANTQSESEGRRFWMASLPTRASSVREGALPTSFSGWSPPSSLANVRRGGASILAALHWPGFQPRARLSPRWAGILRRVALARTHGFSPLQCCYPITPGWEAPSPGIGTTGGSTTWDPSHDNPDARTEIAAQVSGTPVIVAEVVLEGVSVVDAYKLSLAIDGRVQSNWAFFDSLGRVKYDMYDNRGGAKTGVVMIYLGHK